MIALDAWVAVVIGVATIVWLVLFVRAFAARRGASARLTPAERALLVMTLILALLWTCVAPPWSLGVSRRARAIEVARGCGAVRETQPVSRVREILGVPTRKVAEEDVRGPGASAWVYDEERCIVHFMDERVVAVEEE